MLITDVVEWTKNKYKIFIDEEFAFVLYKSELRRFNILLGENLDNQIYQEIISNLLPKRAKNRAIYLLEKRAYTENGMRIKLKENLYSDVIIDDTIDYLKGYGYINDLDYAISYINSCSGNRSARWMQQSLLAKGVSNDAVIAAIDRCQEDSVLGDEHQMIRNILRKKRFGETPVLQKDINKMINYLIGKGFSIDSIMSEIRGYSVAGGDS